MMLRQQIIQNASGTDYFIIQSAGDGKTDILNTKSDGYITFGTANTERMRLDASGNLGLGVTPSAWEIGFKSMQIGNTGVLSNNTSDLRVILNSNSYNNSAGNTTYLVNGFATSYMQISGTHRWYNAPSGTAGNAISFTQAMTLDASGRLGIGTTSPGDKLEVNGNVYATAFHAVGSIARFVAGGGVYI